MVRNTVKMHEGRITNVLFAYTSFRVYLPGLFVDAGLATALPFTNTVGWAGALGRCEGSIERDDGNDKTHGCLIRVNRKWMDVKFKYMANVYMLWL